VVGVLDCLVKIKGSERLQHSWWTPQLKVPQNVRSVQVKIDVYDVHVTPSLGDRCHVF